MNRLSRPGLVREAIGQALRDLRENRGLTLREVADRALVSVGYLSEVERGRKEASSELLNSVCAALGVGPDTLLRLSADRLVAIPVARGNLVHLPVPAPVVEQHSKAA